MEIRHADLADPRVIGLLQRHASAARAQTAQGSAHALDLTSFQSSDIQLWSLWHEDRLVSLGALRRLDDDTGEIKSMHTMQEMRGRGAGQKMLTHLVQTAQLMGLRRVSLETGSWGYFDPARRLYERFGFRECDPFGEYVPDLNSVFMALGLEAIR